MNGSEKMLNGVIYGTEKRPGDICYSTISIKNSSTISFSGVIGFSIKPNNYVSWIDAPYKEIVIGPEQTLTFDSNPITIPSDAATGNVSGWVSVKYYDSEKADYVTLDEKKDSNAYTIIEAPPPGGEIVSKGVS